jgi:hypothetical protein
MIYIRITYFFNKINAKRRLLMSWKDSKPLSKKFIADVAVGLREILKPYGSIYVDEDKIGALLQKTKLGLNGLATCCRIRAEVERGELPDELRGFVPDDICFEIGAKAANIRFEEIANPPIN